MKWIVNWVKSLECVLDSKLSEDLQVFVGHLAVEATVPAWQAGTQHTHLTTFLQYLDSLLWDSRCKLIFYRPPYILGFGQASSVGGIEICVALLTMDILTWTFTMMVQLERGVGYNWDNLPEKLFILAWWSERVKRVAQRQLVKDLFNLGPIHREEDLCSVGLTQND